MTQNQSVIQNLTSEKKYKVINMPMLMKGPTMDVPFSEEENKNINVNVNKYILKNYEQ